MRAPYVFLEGLSAVVYVDCESVKMLSVAIPASNGNLQPSILEVKNPPYRTPLHSPK